MLCDSCHQRPATCHVNAIEGGVVQSRDLCIECYEASSPEARELLDGQREVHCEYCGGQPVAGGTDFLALATGVQKQKFMCLPCSMEHIRFVQERLQEDASDLSQQEQLALLQKLDRDAGEHMMQWVSKKIRHDAG
jgi:protein-arginine kinase activator protein McsA